MFRRVAVLMVILPGLAGLFSVTQSAAQTSGAAFFQTIVVDPYSQALGEATVALRGYPSAATINPASIGRTNTVQLGSNINPDGGGFFQTPWLPDAIDGVWVASQTVDVRFRRWAFGYQYKEFSFGESDFRDAQNNLLGTFELRDHSHKVVAAYALRPNLSVGAGLNLIRSGTVPVVVGPADFDEATTVSLDLGVVYGLDFDVPYARLKPSVGWSLTDFGRKLRFGDDDFEDPLTMMMRGGLSVQVESDAQWLRRPMLTLGLHGALSKTLVGVDEKDGNFESYGPFEALVKAWKPVEVRVNPFNEEVAEFKTLNAIDQLTTHTGLEVSMLKIFAVRWGGYHSSKYLGDRNYDTFGFGIDLYYLALDYSKTNTLDSPFYKTTHWRLTARIPLADSPDNFWPELLKAF